MGTTSEGGKFNDVGQKGTEGRQMMGVRASGPDEGMRRWGREGKRWHPHCDHQPQLWGNLEDQLKLKLKTNIWGGGKGGGGADVLSHQQNIHWLIQEKKSKIKRRTVLPVKVEKREKRE